MGIKDITAGNKRAKPKGLRFIKSPKTGTPAMEIEFEFIEESNNAPERLSYQGWLSDGAKKRTREVLDVVLGYNGSKKTDANGVFTDPAVLDFKREVEIVIELEEYEGKRYPKIKWVNALGGSKFAGAKPEVVSSELDSIGWDALGIETKNSAPAPSTPPPPRGIVPDEELPY